MKDGPPTELQRRGSIQDLETTVNKCTCICYYAYVYAFSYWSDDLLNLLRWNNESMTLKFANQHQRWHFSINFYQQKRDSNLPASTHKTAAQPPSPTITAVAESFDKVF